MADLTEYLASVDARYYRELAAGNPCAPPMIEMPAGVAPTREAVEAAMAEVFDREVRHGDMSLVDYLRMSQDGEHA